MALALQREDGAIGGLALQTFPKEIVSRYDGGNAAWPSAHA